MISMISNRDLATMVLAFMAFSASAVDLSVGVYGDPGCKGAALDAQPYDLQECVCTHVSYNGAAEAFRITVTNNLNDTSYICDLWNSNNPSGACEGQFDMSSDTGTCSVIPKGITPGYIRCGQPLMCVQQ